MQARMSRRAARRTGPGSRIGGAASTTPMVNPTGWAGPARERTVEAMTTAIAPRRGVPARRHRRVPWSPRAWGQALYQAGESRPSSSRWSPCWPGPSAPAGGCDGPSGMAGEVGAAVAAPAPSAWRSCSWPVPRSPDAPAPAARHRRGADTTAADMPDRLSVRGDRRPRPARGPPGASSVITCWPARRWRRPRSPPSGCGWRASSTPWCTPTRGRCPPWSLLGRGQSSPPPGDLPPVC